METFADELRSFVESWRDRFSISDAEIVDALMDEVERLDPEDDDE